MVPFSFFGSAFPASRLYARIGLFALLLAGSGGEALAAPDINGKWQTPAGAVIQIQKCGKVPCGKIVRFPAPKGYSMENTPDINNKDASKRKRKVLGLTVLWRLAPEKDGWKGRVYDPRRGFSANATVRRTNASALEVQGCVRVVFNVCEKETWRRVD